MSLNQAQRIFNIVNSDNNVFNGVVEMDEVYIGGAEKNKRPDRRVNNSNKYLNDKMSVLGIRVFVTRGHFKRYADMFSFRMDTRELTEYERLDLLMTQVNGTRIKFDEISCHGNPGTKKWFPHYGSKRKIVL